MQGDSLDLEKSDVLTTFGKYFIPTLLGMLSLCAVTAVDGIFVGHGIGSDGIAAINICMPLYMILTGMGLRSPFCHIARLYIPDTIVSLYAKASWNSWNMGCSFLLRDAHNIVRIGGLYI